MTRRDLGHQDILDVLAWWAGEDLTADCFADGPYLAEVGRMAEGLALTAVDGSRWVVRVERVEEPD